MENQFKKITNKKNNNIMKNLTDETRKEMKTEQQHELLKNFANALGLNVHVYSHEDKRKDNQFCVYKGKTSVSAEMNYIECNHFLFGWLAAIDNINK